MVNIPRAQEIYRHFKGMVYQIVTLAEHTETEEKLVVYQAMYGDFKIYARPLSMFLEKVDKQKYPDATQEYRFEKVEAAELIAVGTQPAIEPIQTAVGPKQPANEAKETVAASEEELQLDPLVLEFLDADTHERKLNILAALHSRITDDMITIMAVACDIEVEDGDVEKRYSELKNCLLTREKYEINRVRY